MVYKQQQQQQYGDYYDEPSVYPSPSPSLRSPVSSYHHQQQHLQQQQRAAMSPYISSYGSPHPAMKPSSLSLSLSTPMHIPMPMSTHTTHAPHSSTGTGTGSAAPISADGYIYQIHFKRAHRHFLMSYNAMLSGPPIKAGDVYTP